MWWTVWAEVRKYTKLLQHFFASFLAGYTQLIAVPVAMELVITHDTLSLVFFCYRTFLPLAILLLALKNPCGTRNKTFSWLERHLEVLLWKRCTKTDMRKLPQKPLQGPHQTNNLPLTVSSNAEFFWALSQPPSLFAWGITGTECEQTCRFSLFSLYHHCVKWSGSVQVGTEIGELCEFSTQLGKMLCFFPCTPRHLLWNEMITSHNSLHSNI